MPFKPVTSTTQGFDDRIVAASAAEFQPPSSSTLAKIFRKTGLSGVPKMDASERADCSVWVQSLWLRCARSAYRFRNSCQLTLDCNSDGTKPASSGIQTCDRSASCGLHLSWYQARVEPTGAISIRVHSHCRLRTAASSSASVNGILAEAAPFMLLAVRSAQPASIIMIGATRRALSEGKRRPMRTTQPSIEGRRSRRCYR